MSRPEPTRRDMPRPERPGTAGSAAGDAEARSASFEGERTRVLDRPRGAASAAGGEPDVSGEPGADADEPPDAGRSAGGGEAPRRRPRRRWGLRAVALLLLLILATPLLAAFRVWYVAREDIRTHTDAIIVLGAAQYNGRPSSVLEWRLIHALKLYRDGVAPNIVTVGGNRPGDNYTEAGTGKAWLHEHGVPEDRLVAVRTGSDTLQSMIAVGAAYKRRGWHSGTIVTDPWHGLRSRTMARDNGIKAVTSPTRSGPTVGTRDTQFHYIVRETGGYLYYEFIGRWFGDS